MVGRLGRHVAITILSVTGALGAACMLNTSRPMAPGDISKTRLQVIRRAGVWTSVNTRSLNLRTGPGGAGAFAPHQTVTCDYVDERLSGGTPKFACAIGSDQVKVKYGADNGEVFGEVAASRLMWALGFPADAQYPVRVICRGCAADPWTEHARQPGQRTFDSATIERKYPGREITPGGDPGWAWPELDLVDEDAGGAPRAHRDALKLLAVFLQHTDNKPDQQRLLCLDAPSRSNGDDCRRPMMMLNDVGLTYGRANNFNRNAKGSINLRAWSEVPVWRDPERCVGELSKSVTGTLEHPVISEAGRRFLAGLLSQLSDAQLRDLFDVARVAQRRLNDDDPAEAVAVRAWVDAFKRKRQAIVAHRCPA